MNKNIKNKKQYIIFLMLGAYLLLSKNVLASTLNDLMKIDNFGNIIYTDPTTSKFYVISNLEDIKEILKINQNQEQKNEDNTQDLIMGDIPPFADEQNNNIQNEINEIQNHTDMNNAVNIERLNNNLNVLKTKESLILTAQERCLDMAKTDNTTDRSTKEILSSISKNGYNTTLGTELLYWSNMSKTTNQDALDWWMNEPKYHKPNVLKTTFNYIGSADCKSEIGKKYFVSVFAK